VEFDDPPIPVQVTEFQFDTVVGQSQHAGFELLRDALGRVAGYERLQKVQEFSGRAGPLAALLEEGADGFRHGMRQRRWSEGALHFLPGAAESRAGSHGPGERVGAFSGGPVHLGEAAESAADGGAESSEDGRPSLLESVEEAGLGGARGWGQGREGDCEGAFGELAGTRPAAGDGEEHGAPVMLQQGLGGGAGSLADGGADAGGEAAEGIDEGWGEGGNVVEGEDPVVAGEDEEVADGGGDGGEEDGAGIDEAAEDAGGDGLAGAGGTLEDEEWEGSRGAEGGEEPGEAAEPVGAGGEVEAGAEGV